MSNAFSTHSALTYSISTPVYEGPLDLLLQLIEREELDITRLALARVTDQYLEYIHHLEADATDQISAFLVVAAKLLQIKSAALLPRAPSKIDLEEDTGDELIRQLIEYRRYKQASEQLMNREQAGSHTYLRLSSTYQIEPTLDMSGVTTRDLIQAALEAFSRATGEKLINSTLSKIRLNIRNRIKIIARALQGRKRIGFWGLFDKDRTRIDVVVTFLALLELIKQHFVEVTQTGLFEEIEIEQTEAWDLNEEIELEFGE
jgi:segregation and condensation protein A